MLLKMQYQIESLANPVYTTKHAAQAGTTDDLGREDADSPREQTKKGHAPRVEPSTGAARPK